MSPACNDLSLTKISISALNCFVLCGQSVKFRPEPASSQASCVTLSGSVKLPCNPEKKVLEIKIPPGWEGQHTCVSVSSSISSLSCSLVERVLSCTPGDRTSCSQLFPPTIFVLFTTVIKQDHRVFLQHKQKRSILHFRIVVCQ